MLVDYFDTNIQDVYYYIDIQRIVVLILNFVVKNTIFGIVFYFKKLNQTRKKVDKKWILEMKRKNYTILDIKHREYERSMEKIRQLLYIIIMLNCFKIFIKESDDTNFANTI